MLFLLIVAGGGSSFGNAPIAAIESHQGDSDGYVIVEMDEDEYEDTLYTYTGREETFDVQEEGDYELIAVGGRGGWCNKNSGGYGAQASGTFWLSKGDRLHIVVGGKGGDCNRATFTYCRSGAGGAGGSFIELEEGTSKTRKLLIAAGGGGGAGKDYGGGDGEDKQDGWPDWGGKNGYGGGLSCREVGCTLGIFLNGGAGGGGYHGDGKSRCGDAKSLKCDFGSHYSDCGDDNVLAAGGESFRNGGKGGQQKALFNSKQCSSCDCFMWGYFYGGYGGFGGGGEGGICRWKIINDGGCHDCYKYGSPEHGGGGGGGGHSGGGAGQLQGQSGGG